MHGQPSLGLYVDPPVPARPGRVLHGRNPLYACARVPHKPLCNRLIFLTDARLENISQHPHYFEVDETHTKVESSQGSYLISELILC